MLGSILHDRYQIIEFLGKGGFGDTYVAKDLDLPGQPQCVIKHFKPKDLNPAFLPIARRLFDTEAQTLYKLSKLNDQIPTLFAHFEENGEFYLVQDFIAGHDFTKELIPGKKLATFIAISTNTTRRNLLQLAGLAIVGFVGAVVSQNFGNKSDQAATDQLSSPILPNDKSSPLLSPETPTLKTVEFETVTVDVTGQITKRRQSQAQVFTETIANGITLEMMAIPGGSFVMGSPNTEAGRSNDEGPQRTVNVAAFFMGKYEVTQTGWRAVAALAKVKIDLNANPSNFKGDNLPVEKVSWDDAIEFCARLSQLTGHSYRLPSEAEWEYACRAGTTTPFYFGDTVTPDLVNYNGNNPYGSAPKGTYRKKTTAVGSFPANAFGLYDMHGNVLEWCQDVWHDNYNGVPTDGSAWESGGDNTTRLLRGGSGHSIARHCRAARRFGNSPDTRDSGIGFRVVRA